MDKLGLGGVGGFGPLAGRKIRKPFELEFNFGGKNSQGIDEAGRVRGERGGSAECAGFGDFGFVISAESNLMSQKIMT